MDRRCTQILISLGAPVTYQPTNLGWHVRGDFLVLFVTVSLPMRASGGNFGGETDTLSSNIWEEEFP